MLVPDDQPAKPSQPTKPKFKVKWLAQPLYSRVDAISMSVFVVRQTTRLANTNQDTFRQEDPTDAAFIVGLSRPFTFTLWQNDRHVVQRMAHKIEGNVKKPYAIYFRIAPVGSEPPGMRPALLRFANWSPEQYFSLWAKIRQTGEYKAGNVVPLQLDDDSPALGKIEIGLAVKPKDPDKLMGLTSPYVPEDGGAASP